MSSDPMSESPYRSGPPAPSSEELQTISRLLRSCRPEDNDRAERMLTEVVKNRYGCGGKATGKEETIVRDLMRSIRGVDNDRAERMLREVGEPYWSGDIANRLEGSIREKDRDRAERIRATWRARRNYGV